MSDSFVHFLSGALGGVVSTTATYPVLNIATRLQVRDKYRNNTLAALASILEEDGVSALYAGLSPAIVGVAASQGVFYYSYELIKHEWTTLRPSKNLATWENLVVGALAGVAAAVTSNPLWVVNTRMSVMEKSGGPKKNAVATLLDIVQNEGVGALFKGLIPSLILVVNPSIQYMVFERLRVRVERTRKLGELDFFWLGLVSKFVASTITYPYILAKSKLQASLKDDTAAHLSDTWPLLVSIAKKEGLEGLFRGYAPKITQSVMTAAILFLAKEKFFQWTIALLVLMRLRPRALKKVAAA